MSSAHAVWGRHAPAVHPRVHAARDSDAPIASQVTSSVPSAEQVVVEGVHTFATHTGPIADSTQCSVPAHAALAMPPGPQNIRTLPTQCSSAGVQRGPVSGGTNASGMNASGGTKASAVNASGTNASTGGSTK